jgi:hypothetical protein
MSEGVEFSGLASVFDASDHVQVVAGSSFDPRHRRANTVLADIRDPRLLTSLAEALVAGPEGDVSMMTVGDPSIAFLRGRELIAVVQCLPGYVRCNAIWPSDARLANAAALEHWLATVVQPS